MKGVRTRLGAKKGFLKIQTSVPNCTVALFSLSNKQIFTRVVQTIAPLQERVGKGDSMLGGDTIFRRLLIGITEFFPSQFFSIAWREMSQYLGAKLHSATSHYYEAEGIIQRFNRTLKTNLICYGSPYDWYDHIPRVELALINTPKQDLSNFSPTKLLFGDSARLSGEFFEERDPNTRFEAGLDIAPNLYRFITSLPYFHPRNIHKQRLLDPFLFSVEITHVCVRIDNHKSPLTFVYMGPYKNIVRNPKYFVLDFKGKLDKILVDHLKVAHLSIETLNNEILLSTLPSKPTGLFPSSRASCDDTPTTITNLNSPDSPVDYVSCWPAYLQTCLFGELYFEVYMSLCLYRRSEPVTSSCVVLFRLFFCVLFVC